MPKLCRSCWATKMWDSVVSGANKLSAKLFGEAKRETATNLKVTGPVENARGKGIIQQRPQKLANKFKYNPTPPPPETNKTAPAAGESEMAHNVDLGFLKKVEGFETEGYVPDVGKSGVTIASGFDLGQHSVREIKELVPALADRLTPYAGLTRKEAEEKLKQQPLKLTDDEAEIVNRSVKARKVDDVRKSFDASSETPFDSLPPEWQTVIASVAFQYGKLDKQTPNFWRQITSGDWKGAYDNLRNFGDDFQSRRNQEAELVKGLIE